VPARLLRLTAVACVTVALGAVAAPGASAHGGQSRTVVSAGPYRLVIDARPVAADSLAFAATITGRLSEAPVDSASVRVVVASRDGSERGPYRAAGFGGAYSLLVPIANSDTWRSLRFTIDVDGPLGTASTRYRPPSLFGRWLLAPLVLVLATLGAALFLQGWIRLRGRGRADHASFGRVTLFALGLCLMVGALVSPLDPLGDRYLVSAHMLEHVTIGDAAPALLLLAIRGPLSFFVLPRGAVRVLGRTGWIRLAAAWLLRPRIALGAWALAFGIWHVPAIYDFAATHHTVHELEHASFVLAGFLVWTLLIDPSGHCGLSRGQRLSVAASVFGMGTALSAVFVFSLSPLYPVYAGQAERVFSMAPLRDQQLAGVVMTTEQILAFGTCALVLLLPSLRTARRRPPFVARRERLA